MPMPLRLTNAPPMLDIEMEWTLNASLMRLSSYRKCSKRRILGHSAQATSLLPIEGTTKCSRIARGFAFGSVMGFAVEVKAKAGFGVRASAAFTVLKASDIGGLADREGQSMYQVGHKPWR
jgi:hypothetical protein